MTDTPVPSKPTKPSVNVGTRVQVVLLNTQGEPETLEFDLVPDAEADFGQGYLGLGTPLARAIIGHAEGDIVRYRAEGVTAVQIAKVTPAAPAPATNKDAERQAVIGRAVAQSEALNDAAFAMAAGSKWGDYDPAAQVTEVVPTAAKATPRKHASPTRKTRAGKSPKR